MDIEKIKKQLEKESFRYVFEWEDAPDIEYQKHSHKDKVVFYIVYGGVTIYFEDKTLEFKKGDRFDVPVGIEHTAKVGNQGCKWVVGEMIEGDA
jgi:mannose-6-phosphate isomerase-like protein (cupin superfamily)